jgi:hypothetical protein
MKQTTKNKKKGFIYILYHESFQHYGENVYKLGWSIDTKMRMQTGYTTPFMTKPEYKYISSEFEDGYKAERILFYLLRRERCKANREFFEYSLDAIIECIKKLEEYKDYINQLYNFMCLELLPIEVQLELKCGLNEKCGTSGTSGTSGVSETDKIKDLFESKYKDIEFTDTNSVCLFLEQFRFNPYKSKVCKDVISPEAYDMYQLISKSKKDNKTFDISNKE